MLKTLLVASLAAWSVNATAASGFPGIERRASLPSRCINQGYPISGAVTNDGFTVTFVMSRYHRTAHFAPLATEPTGDADPLAISPFNKMGGLPHGIVTAWVDESYHNPSFSVSTRAGEVGVARDLPLLDPSGAEIESVTANRTHALILSRNNYRREHLWASVLDADGTIVGAPIEVVTRSVDRAMGVSAASDPGGFLIVHYGETGRKLFATRITNGAEVTKFTIPLDAPISETFAAFDGSKYLIALQEGAAIRGFLMTVKGGTRSEPFTIDANARVVAVVGRSGGSLFVASNKAFAFDHVTRTHGPSHPVRDVATLVLSDGRYALATFANHPDFPIGTGTGQWFDAQTAQPLSAPFALSYGSPMQQEPAVALGEGVDLLVWSERDPVTLKDAIRGTRIGPHGGVLDEPSLRFSLPDTKNSRPAVAFNGRDFVVAWKEEIPDIPWMQHVRLQRLTRDGLVLDSVPRDIGTAWGWNDLEVAHSADTTLILWIGPAGHAFQTQGRRMNLDGELLDANPLRLTQDEAPVHYSMDLAAGTDEGAGTFLVTWIQKIDNETATLHYALLDKSGGILVQRVLHNASEPTGYRPLVAWNGSEYLVVWRTQATMITRVGWPYPVRTLDVAGVWELGSVGLSWCIIQGDDYTSLSGWALLDGWNLWVDASAPFESPTAYERMAANPARTILAYARPIREPQHADSYRVIYRLYPDPAPPVRRRPARP